MFIISRRLAPAGLAARGIFPLLLLLFVLDVSLVSFSRREDALVPRKAFPAKPPPHTLRTYVNGEN